MLHNRVVGFGAGTGCLAPFYFLIHKLFSPGRNILLFSLTLGACVYNEMEPPADCVSNPVKVDLVSSADADCGLQNGSFEVIASGGAGAYKFSVNNGTLQSSGEFTSLGAGTYSVTVVDEKNCSATLDVQIGNKDGVNVEATSTDAGCKTNNGRIEAEALNGTPPYTFKLNAGAFQTGGTFTGLSSGAYTLTAKDASGCEASITLVVDSGISFASDISSIIQTNCAISGCHAGTQSPDFRVFKNIQDNAARIKTQTSTRAMPVGRTLTQNEIDMIGCWVDDGAKNN